MTQMLGVSICTHGLHSGKLYLRMYTQNRIPLKIFGILNWMPVDFSGLTSVFTNVCRSILHSF